MRIQSAADLKVRDCVTGQFVPSDGLEIADTNGVADNPYWQFMLAHGDVVVAAEPTPAAAASVSAPQAAASATPATAGTVSSSGAAA